MSSRVISVRPISDFVLEITFDDGNFFTLDFKPMIEHESGWLYDDLKQPEVFQQVKVNALTLEWPTGLDICPDTLRLWCENNRIMSQEEIDAYFAKLSRSHAPSSQAKSFA